jgi:beta-N-acetylhexosaminidase
VRAPGAIICVVLVAVFTRSFAQTHSFFDKGEEAALAAAIVSEMKDEELLGQMFMIAYPGTRPDANCLRWIRERGAGGVKIFGWNAQDERALVESIELAQKTSLEGRFGIPLLVATDQEGGWIRHVGGRTSRTPGNMALGASGFPQDAYDSGLIIGAELAALGINMNFAPVVDVASNPKSWVIGSRSFSADPMEAAILGAAYARGLGDSGVIATAKHYPGHGDTALDSHVSLPSISADWKTLWARELLPYRVLAKDGVPAIMSGHISFPALGKGDGPASLSEFFMKDVLRDKIGFKGVVVTDDLRMEGAISSAGSLSAAIIQAIRAGNDLILTSSLPGVEPRPRDAEGGRALQGTLRGIGQADPGTQAREAQGKGRSHVRA